MMIKQLNRSSNQQGAVLIVVMVLMLIMAMIGVSAMQSTTLEERMSANMRDRVVALQAAERALNEGEGYLAAIVDIADFTQNTAGLYEENNQVWKNLDWKNGEVVTVDDGPEEAALEPRYIIELGKTKEVGGNSLADFNYAAGSGEAQTGSEITFFTITAMGYGSSEDAQVLLQAHYGKRL